LLLRIARPLFNKWAALPDTDATENYIFRAWLGLRDTVALMQQQRAVCMTPEQRERMVGALKVAHEYAHDADIDGVPSVEHCPCPTAQWCCDLALVLAVHDADEATA
jgi:hypothetical protein